MRLRHAHFLLLLLVGCNGTPSPGSTSGQERRILPPPETTLVPPALEHLGTSDFFYFQFRAYMSPNLRQRYLDTAQEKRLEVFGPQLLDFQRREALLAPVRHTLTREEIRQYHHLDSLEACKQFLANRKP